MCCVLYRPPLWCVLVYCGCVRGVTLLPLRGIWWCSCVVLACCRWINLVLCFESVLWLRRRCVAALGSVIAICSSVLAGWLVCGADVACCRIVWLWMFKIYVEPLPGGFLYIWLHCSDVCSCSGFFVVVVAVQFALPLCCVLVYCCVVGMLVSCCCRDVCCCCVLLLHVTVARHDCKWAWLELQKRI